MNPATRGALVLTCVPAFMVALDNLVVTNALATIRRDLGASVPALSWVINAYVLAFGVLMLTAATLGDRFGRRRTFSVGLVIFSLASAAAALAPNVAALIAARALQGLGAAVVMPLSLALLCDGFPRGARGAVIGVYGGVTGAAVAIGPVVGGAIVEGLSWHWIFWLNVPVGLIAAAAAPRLLPESHGPRRPLDGIGLALASTGLFAVVWGIIRGNTVGWTSPEIVAALAGGVVLLAAFLVREHTTTTPMMPRALLRDGGLAANAATFLMAASLFAAAFLVPQYLQTALGHSPLQAGLRLLLWTAVPLVVTPLAGVWADKVGNRLLIVTGLLLQAAGFAWLATEMTSTSGYLSMSGPFLLAGIGIGLVFPSVANAVMSGRPVEETGLASATNASFREIGGVFGVATATAAFGHNGGLTSAHAFAQGTVAALSVAAAFSAVGALGALRAPRQTLPLVEASVAP